CSFSYHDGRRHARQAVREASPTACTGRGETSVRLVPEVCPGDPLLQGLESPEGLDDVAARVVEENLPVLVSADRDQPLEIVAVLEQIVDGLRDAASGDDGDLRSRGPLRLLRHWAQVNTNSATVST